MTEEAQAIIGQHTILREAAFVSYWTRLLGFGPLLRLISAVYIHPLVEGANMAKNDQEEAYEKFLSASLARITDFLKFAEAKNAALLTFSSAWILASANLLSTDKHLPPHFDAALKLDIVLFSVVALVAFSAILPKLKISDFAGTTAPPANNLLFFGDIASFDTEIFKERVRQRYMPEQSRSATDYYFDDLAAQIAINSQIANRKFKLFNWGARVALLGVLVMLWPACNLTWEWARSMF